MSAQAAEETVEAGDAVDELDGMIAALMEGREATKAERLWMDGHDFQLAKVTIPETDNERAVRNIRGAPLEQIYHRKRNPIELYQYVAGTRYRMDWYQSQLSPMRAVDIEATAIFITKEVANATNNPLNGQRMAVSGQSVKRVSTIPDSRLDALRRLGDVTASLSNFDGWLARAFIGEERSVPQIAKHMDRDERYVGERVREMLTALAAFYRLRHLSTR